MYKECNIDGDRAQCRLLTLDTWEHLWFHVGVGIGHSCICRTSTMFGKCITKAKTLRVQPNILAETLSNV